MNKSATISLSSDPNELMKEHGKSFHFASRLLGQSTGEKVAKLYSLCRFIDDCADELEPELSQRELARLRMDLDKYASVWKINKEHLNELLKGAEFDARCGQIDSRKDLLIYCYRVAGAVGLMMNPIIGVHEKKANSFSIDLGIGMQLTNICRDVLEDAINNRFYLPLSELKTTGLSKTQLSLKGKTPLALKTLVKHYLDLADTYYESAKKGYAYIPLRSRFTVHIAAGLYQEIGKTIRRMDYEVLSGRAYVPTWMKILVSLKACGAIFRLFFWKKDLHRQTLHCELKGLPGVEAI